MVKGKDKLMEEICSFVNKMKGKSIASNEEIREMFGLYNRHYKTTETNYSCELCVIRIFTKLEKIKKNYENRP